MADRNEFSFTCPLPAPSGNRIQLAHGGGGRLTKQLIDRIFVPAFANPELAELHDGATFASPGQRLAFTTDSYVVHPLLFPGGTIGDLAVNGTANDLAMCGARPLYLSAGFVLEEGLEVEILQAVVESMRVAAERAGVRIVTGDTKVVDKRKGDGIYINTAGIGVVETAQPVSPERIRPGDVVLLSGEIGAHGIAVLSVREGLEFEAPIVSDTAAVWPAVEALIAAGIDIHCLRDATRGGVATTLNELASASGTSIIIDEAAVPVDETVRAAAEILGLDPLYIANEGRFLAIVPEEQGDRSLAVLRQVELSAGACMAGRVEAAPAGQVALRSLIRGMRVLDLLSGEQLPRIC